MTRSLGLGKRVGLGFLLVSAMAPILGVISVLVGARQAEEHRIRDEKQVATVLNLWRAMEAGLRISVAVNDAQSRYPDAAGVEAALRPAQSAVDEVLACAATYDETDCAENPELVGPVVIGARDLAEATARLCEGAMRTSSAARVSDLDREFDRTLDQFVAAVEHARETEQEEMEAGDLVIQSVLKRGMLLNAAVSGAAFVLALGCGIALTRSITRPLRTLADAADQFGRGNLDVALEIRSADEIGMLASRMRQMAESLRTTQGDLERSRMDAEAANRAKSEFLANMSHEIRTPMTAILGYAEVLQGELPDADRQENLRIIRRNGEHLLTLINDILDLSKIEAGKLSVEISRCPVHEVVSEVAALMRVRAAGKGVQLQVEYAYPVPESIASDPARLRQILMNLVGNAVKFTEQGSVRVIVRTQGEHVELDVTDTGIGMTRGQITRLFLPFSQADGSTTRRYGGSGLGLFISKRLAELLGGAISVRSEAGRGSTFTLSLPMGDLAGVRMIQAPGEAILDGAQDAAKPAPKLQGRILLAEDGPDNQRLISFHLRKGGATVDVVEDGRAAVDAVEAADKAGTRYDLVLMDMQMPRMDGYEATRELRRRGVKTPVVALTAHAMAGDRKKSTDAGCDDYATKPIDRRRLLEVCTRWMRAA